MDSGAVRSIDDVLCEARARLQRVGPAELAAALERGALVVDTRPVAQRAEHGQIPGAIV
ncbi:MAG: hypothetical protein QOF57_2352, partial [Frankiaceae bacterium]|nr:hypothetical protein [Frankiaceae bacterium]